MKPQAKRLKPLLPTLKEKKRYLAFEIVSKGKIKAFPEVSKAIWTATLSFVGTKGAAELGLWVHGEKYQPESQRGLIRVTHKGLDTARAALCLVKEIESQPVIVKSLGASGIINKVEKKYLGTTH
jgi:ribonuclease P/MRP protein subunit POP5